MCTSNALIRNIRRYLDDVKYKWLNKEQIYYYYYYYYSAT